MEIGLERTSYTTEEEVVNVEVCARIQRGMLEREVQVDLQTFDGTAVSKSPPEPHTFFGAAIYSGAELRRK